MHIPLVQLPTLQSRPSWTNHGGKVDRSACALVTAGEVRRRLRPGALRKARTFAKVGARALARGRTEARTHREAVATFRMTAELLAELHAARQPRALSGDYRSAKANAMKVVAGPRRDPRHGRVMRRRGPDQGLTRNPNRTLTTVDADSPLGKMLGLPIDWSQAITIERWRMHARLAQHLVICPRCKEKCVKLFLPLCRADELRDALLAQSWLDAWDSAVASHPHLTEAAAFRAALIDRYGPLLHTTKQPREMVCRKCLGLRYGEGNRKRQPRKVGAR